MSNKTRDIYGSTVDHSSLVQYAAFFKLLFILGLYIIAFKLHISHVMHFTVQTVLVTMADFIITFSDLFALVSYNNSDNDADLIDHIG